MSVKILQIDDAITNLQGMYHPRLQTDRLRQLSGNFPVVVVTGARQVGKTTLLRHVFPDHNYAVFDASLDLEDARREPDLFLLNHPPPVILDEVQFAPEVVYAQNQDLPAPGVRRWRGDLPDRFGTETYQRSSSGQSYIKLNVDFLTVGLSSANVAWGPGRFSTVMLSENAPGMNHFSVESNKPLKTKWGTLEGQFLTGKLKHSGFSYSTGPTGDGSSLEPVFVVPGLDTTFRVWTGAVGVFSPTILPGFSLGVTRVVFTDGPVTNPNYSDYIALFFSNPFRGGGGGTQVGVNQMAGAFVRYVMPESHMEFYGEYGFDDNRYDLEDLIVSPDHSRGYMWGVRKLQPVNGTKEYWDFTYEMGQYEGAKEMLNRTQFGYAVFYDGSPSNSGQYLGAGIGSGSNQWILNLDKVKENKRIGFTYERIARNNDALYERRVPWVGTWYGFDFTKKYVESSLGLNYSERRGPVLFWAKALLTTWASSSRKSSCSGVSLFCT